MENRSFLHHDLNTLIASILETHALTTPDARPLHAYRIDETTYDQLQLFCMTAQPHVDGNYPKVFVLWASEYFRSSYTGSGLKWDFLTDALGRKIGWQQLAGITAKGLKYWKRPLRKGGNHRLFLQSLLVEGGLPQELLKADGRYRVQIMRLISDAEMRGRLASEAMPGLVRAAIARWPEGFRQDDVVNLVQQLVFRLVELRNMIHPSIPRAASVDWLDGKMPGWRDDLPLNIGAEAAHSLLDEAMRAERKVNTHKDFVLRVLRKAENDSWLPYVEFTENSSVDRELIGLSDPTLQTIRLRPAGALSSRIPGLMIRGDLSEDGMTWKLRRSSGRRTELVSWPLDEPLNFSVWADGKVAREIVIPGLERPNEERSVTGIWVTRDKTVDAPDRLDYLTDGRVATSASRVFLNARSDAVLEFFGSLQNIGEATCGDEKLLCITGQGHLLCDGQKVTIKTTSDEEFGAQIRPLGDIIRGVRTLSGEVIFQGWPQFFGAEAGSYGVVLSKRNLRTLRRGGKWVTPGQGRTFGGSTIGWISGGEIIARQRVWILPSGFGLKIREGAQERYVCLSGLHVGILAACGDQTAVVNEGGAVEVSLAGFSKQTTKVNLELSFGKDRLRLQVDLWSTVGVIIGPDDLQLTQRTTIARDKLSDWRLFCPDHSGGMLSVQLKGRAGTHWPSVSFRLNREASLGAYATFIKSTLSLGGPDAEVEISVLSHGHESPKLVIAHATSRLDVNKEQIGWADCDLETLTWQSLSKPSLSVTQRISPMEREVQVPSELDLSVGPWMVVATVSGGGALRPAVLPVLPAGYLNDAAAFSLDLQAASDAPTREQRIAKISECFRHRVSNASDPDWALLEQLIDAVSDKTDAAWLDQVQVLARVPEAATLMLMKCGGDRLADRLTLEEEAPFAWSVLPLSAWRRSITTFHLNLLREIGEAGLPEENTKKIALEAIVVLCEKLVSLRPELSAQIFFALLENFSLVDVIGRSFVPPPQPMASIKEQAERAVKRRLFEGCKLPNHKANGDWATFNRYQPECHPLLFAPIIAAELVMNERKDWPELAMGLLQAQQIDPMYFETTLPAAIAYLYSQKATK